MRYVIPFEKGSENSAGAKGIGLKGDEEEDGR